MVAAPPWSKAVLTLIDSNRLEFVAVPFGRYKKILGSDPEIGGALVASVSLIHIRSHKTLEIDTSSQYHWVIYIISGQRGSFTLNAKVHRAKAGCGVYLGLNDTLRVTAGDRTLQVFCLAVKNPDGENIVRGSYYFNRFKLPMMHSQDANGTVNRERTFFLNATDNGLGIGKSRCCQFGSMEYKPGASSPYHKHVGRSEHFYYILDGNGSVKSQETALTEVSPGTLVFIPPCELHQLNSTSEAGLFYLEFQGPNSGFRTEMEYPPGTEGDQARERDLKWHRKDGGSWSQS